MTTLPRSNKCFQPSIVLAVALIAALLFALVISVVFDGETRWHLLYYYVPVVVPFITYLCDRVERCASLRNSFYLIDVPVVILAAARAIFPVPLISGHALFLVYALLTTQSWMPRASALVVLIETAYLKIFVWQDVTLIRGAVLGFMMAGIFYLSQRIRPRVEVIDG